MSFTGKEGFSVARAIYDNIPLSVRSFGDSHETALRIKALVKPGQNYLDRNPISSFFIVGNYQTADYILRNTDMFPRDILQNGASGKLGSFVTRDDRQYENVKEVTRASRALVRSTFPGYDEAIVEEANKVLDQIRPGQPVDLKVMTLDMMSRIAPRTLAGGRELPHGLGEKMVTVMVGATNPKLWLSREYNQTVREVNQGLTDFIKGNADKDLGLIGHFFKYLPEDQAILESVGMMVAGIETTANTVARQLYEHAKNPETYERVREESISGSSTDYSDAAFEETARMYPIAWRSTRKPVKATQVEDFSLPANCLISTVPYIYLRDENIFIDPNTYNPQRFIDSPKLEIIADHAWGAGPHTCAGLALAKYEGPKITQEVTRRFKNIEPLDPNASDEPIYQASMQSPPLMVVFS